MTESMIAVTGSSGAVGGHVALQLAEAGLGQRLLARDVTRAPDLVGAVAYPCSYADRDASVAALEGVDTLFMVSAAENEHRLDEHRTFIDAAREAGVRHVVYTSFLGAAEDAEFTLGRDHWATEERLKASGMDWTFLRDSFYADIMEMFADDEGVIRGPAGDGRVSVVTQLDVARSAVAVLQDVAAHRGATYDITGPEALTLTEVAATIARARDADVTFHDETVEEAWASRASYGVPDWQMEAWVSTYTAIRAGEVAAVTDHVERLTGIRATSLADLLAQPDA
ncbi:SDR family oxidoreductase [Aeromicrobium sp. CF3.5]|uniref:SDR family oxidoreductase n=1 Tax=Aeromicrobium sp. CF3.5 TaxID=3373078 RepID=UPI003EE8002B